MQKERAHIMKYLVILGDGMADYPFEQFNQQTALQYARTPNFDSLAVEGELGLAGTVPDGLPPGSDTANLSILGYDPLKYYTGRSPFEAASMGIELRPEDVSFRCNLVTLSDETKYADKTMVDYCAGEISTVEAEELIAAISRELGSAEISFHTGFQFRNLMVWQGAPDNWQLTPPHDISGQKIVSHLPAGSESSKILELMERSSQLLSEHPVNKKRLEKGLHPANSIWIWGNGRKPQLPLFHDKYGLNGAVISAVDLIKGIGLFAGMEPILVEGATGYIDTNLTGKVNAVLKAFRNGKDFVYLHIEAPDECSHRFEAENKIKAIEMIDKQVAGFLRQELAKSDWDFSILLATDHATPLSLGTHTREPVPFAIFRSSESRRSPGRKFDEKSAAETGLLFAEGWRIMDYFITGK